MLAWWGTQVKMPALVTHLAVLRPDGMSANDEWNVLELAHLTQLCERHSVNPPSPGAELYIVDMGPYHLRYERHADFSTYTFTRFLPKQLTNPFDETATPIQLVNQDWLTSFPGRVILGTHISADSVSRTHHQVYYTQPPSHTCPLCPSQLKVVLRNHLLIHHPCRLACALCAAHAAFW